MLTIDEEIKHLKEQRISQIILKVIEDAKETQRFRYGDRGGSFIDSNILTEKLVTALKEVI